jgi:hypothetical protein
MKFDFKIHVNPWNANGLIRRTGLLMVLGLALSRPGFSQQTSDSPRPDYSKFGLITSRNIFDPTRYGRSSGSYSPAARRYDSLTLVGTMVYAKGPYAFFDGTSSSFRKVVQDSDKVADFKVSDISPDGAKLSGTNNTQFDLHVGMQLRKYEDGSWHPVASPELTPLTSAQAAGVELPQRTIVQSEGTNSEPGLDIQTLSTDAIQMATPEASPDNVTNAPANGPAASGETDPVLLRLMQRRQQENQ